MNHSGHLSRRAAFTREPYLRPSDKFFDGQDGLVRKAAEHGSAKLLDALTRYYETLHRASTTLPQEIRPADIDSVES